jgi:hypothetical protein
MRTLKVLLFCLLFFNCQKNDDCITIIEKKNIENNYYFLFEANNITNNTNNLQSTNIPDQYSSGQVDEKTYQSYNIGDLYCNN